jgi:hypothetical protein
MRGGHLADKRGSFCLVMALLIGYGSRLVSREERKDADRSSAQDDLFHAPFELSIRLVAKVYSPRKKSIGYPSKKRKWDWVLHGFAASHEPRRELQEVAKRHDGRTTHPSGSFLHRDGIRCSRSICPLKVTGWHVL